MDNEEAFKASQQGEWPVQSKPIQRGGGPPKAPPGAPPDEPGGGASRWIVPLKVIIVGDEENKVFITYVPLLNNISTFGDTVDEALQHTREAIHGYIEAAKKGGIHIKEVIEATEWVDLEISGEDTRDALMRNGYRLFHSSGSHFYLLHPSANSLVCIPVYTGRHLPPTTLRSIIRQAGLPINEFRRML